MGLPDRVQQAGKVGGTRCGVEKNKWRAVPASIRRARTRGSGTHESGKMGLTKTASRVFDALRVLVGVVRRGLRQVGQGWRMETDVYRSEFTKDGKAEEWQDWDGLKGGRLKHEVWREVKELKGVLCAYGGRRWSGGQRQRAMKIVLGDSDGTGGGYTALEEMLWL